LLESKYPLKEERRGLLIHDRIELAPWAPILRVYVGGDSWQGVYFCWIQPLDDDVEHVLDVVSPFDYRSNSGSTRLSFVQQNARWQVSGQSSYATLLNLARALGAEPSRRPSPPVS